MLRILFLCMFAILFLVSCSRDPVNVRDLFLTSIHSQSCKNTQDHFEPMFEPTCVEIDNIKGILEGAFGSTSFDLSHVTPRSEMPSIFLGALGHGVEFYEYFGLSLFGENEQDGEIRLFFCSSYTFRVCRVEFWKYD